MLKIKKIESFYWRNIYCSHPVLLTEVENANNEWTFKTLDPEVRDIISNRFELIKKSNGNLGSLEFLSIIGLSSQIEKFPELEQGTGVKENKFWFTTNDHFHASTVVVNAIWLLNQLQKNPLISCSECTKIIDTFDNNCEHIALDQSVRAMVQEAEKRDIPWFRMSGNSRDIQLGQGYLQERMHETLSSNENQLAVAYSRDKVATNNLLLPIGIPVGRYAPANNVEDAVKASKQIGFPVVLKPNFGGRGVDVIVGLNNAEAVKNIAEKLFTRNSHLIVQSVLPGEDYRVLLVKGKMVAAARREPASVIGNGKHTIKELIDEANLDERRGSGFLKLMNFIVIDDELQRLLFQQKYTLSSIPENGVKVKLRLTANIAKGGTAVDVTDIIHKDNIRICERAAAALGLNVAGVDLIVPDITRSWKEVGGGICEINACPGMRPHWISNPKRDVVGPIFDTVYKKGENGRIPTAMITGSNGKTTTTRMLDHILRAAGHVVGSATSDGATINGEYINTSDIAGAAGALMVLRDPTVTAASLETARGGLVKRGIHLKKCDVAALLNVQHEQVGIDGIETVEEMAKLKRNVIETAEKKIILNAEDKLCAAMIKDFPTDKVILFAFDKNNKAIQKHLKSGGSAVTIDEVKGKKQIVLIENEKQKNIVAIENIPATYKGQIKHNIANAMAAAALATGMDIDIKTIAKGLSEFGSSEGDSLGRFDVVDDLPVKAVFDYAHNPPAISSFIDAVKSIKVKGKIICAVTSPGTRPDFQIEDCAKTVSGNFDHYICYERIDWRRGRPEGEITGLLEKGLLDSKIKNENISKAITLAEAMKEAARIAKKDDLIIVLGSEVRVSLPELKKHFDKSSGKQNKQASV